MDDELLAGLRRIDEAKATPLQDAIANAGGRGFELTLTKADGLKAAGTIELGHDTALTGAASKSLVRKGWDWMVGFSWRPK